jgi:KAP family P-loop domain
MADLIGQKFQMCYPAWVDRVALVIRSSDHASSIGLFGRWGSGKTTACRAVMEALRLQSTAQRYLRSVRIDAHVVALAGSAGPSAIVLQLVRQLEEWKNSDKKLDPTVVLKLAHFAMNAMAPLLVGAATHGAGLASSFLGTKGLSTLAELFKGSNVQPIVDSVVKGGSKALQQKAAKFSEDSAVNWEKQLDGFELVLFIDDLDRCSPEDAARMLSSAAGSFDKHRIRIVFVLDPEMLASHFSRQFNVDRTAALEWTLKYFNASITLPIGATSKHRETLEIELANLNFGIKPSPELLDVACRSVGFVPIREVLSALPQAALWVSWAGDCNVSPYFFLAVLAQVAPEVLRIAARSAPLIGQLPQLVADHMGAEQGGGLTRNFGKTSIQTLQSRPDLAQLGQHLLSNWQPPGHELETIVRVIANAGEPAPSLD